MTGPESPLDWTEDGQPRSRLFGDVYFSAEDGLAETRAVFLKGCGMPDAWRGRGRFVVGELGFGTGLNIAALLDLWMCTREPGAQLHVFSVEAHPIAREEAERALSRWSEIAGAAALLLKRWPGRATGVHRVEIAEAGAILDLAVMDVEEALAGWQGRADAWFLDGFSPALNPQMWRDEMLALVGARSAPGARAATFTVAGQVRRGLAAAGFEVAKQPGFGRKRERLEARRRGEIEGGRAPLRVAIVGGGIAGASAARALRALGADALIVDPQPGSGGSGNPAALVTPRLDAGGGPPARLFAQTFARAVALMEAEAPEAIIARGVLQLASGTKDAERFGRIASSGLFEPGALALLDAGTVSERLGEPAPAAFAQQSALVIEPATVLARWLGDTLAMEAARVEPAGPGWRLLDAAGKAIVEPDVVIVAGGAGSRRILPELPLSPVRGQASWTQTVAYEGPPAAWGGYVVPTRDGLLFGATHDRDDEGTEVRSGDHGRNLATLAEALPALADKVRHAPLEGRASVRATTPDRLPIAGELAPGLFALTGFGSRGFAFAPLLAEHVAALATGAPSPLLRDLAELVDPRRFARRAARRTSS